MKSDIAVSLKDVSKLYLLYDKPQDRLKQALFRRLGKNYARTFWALQDITLDVPRGTTLGIIGRNGSGKSTLLQIIAGTLTPTHGSIQVNGRVAALLELGAGFNPEFTGRENIFLNGTILGISEEEMRRRQDEIIDFAQIGQFIDQPVKFYSSGMYVRLAFAIAACVEPDIFIIDEALAVGDAGFVIKCMNRMKHLRERGTTIILVTHEIQSIRTFCDYAVWLEGGKVKSSGSPLEVSSQYLQYLFGGETTNEQVTTTPTETDQNQPAPHKKDSPFANRQDLVRWGNGGMEIINFSLSSDYDTNNGIFEYGQTLHVVLEILILEDISSKTVGFGFSFRNNKGLDVIASTTYELGYRFPDLKKGQVVRMASDVENILCPGDYALVLNAENRDGANPVYYDYIENATVFKVVSGFTIYSSVLPKIQHRINVR